MQSSQIRRRCISAERTLCFQVAKIYVYVWCALLPCYEKPHWNAKLVFLLAETRLSLRRNAE